MAACSAKSLPMLSRPSAGASGRDHGNAQAHNGLGYICHRHREVNGDTIRTVGGSLLNDVVLHDNMLPKNDSR